MTAFSWRRGRFALPVAATVCVLNTAFAVMISSGAATGSNIAPPSAAPALVAGRVSAINPKKMTLTIADRALVLHPTDLRVYAGNALVPITELQLGARVRYALEPGAGRRVVLILIDGQL